MLYFIFASLIPAFRFALFIMLEVISVCKILVTIRVILALEFKVIQHVHDMPIRLVIFRGATSFWALFTYQTIDTIFTKERRAGWI
jgi:hypothetical protein